MNFSKTDVNLYFIDDEPHIRIVDRDACNRCGNRPCVVSCPANCYRVDPSTGRVEFSHLGCLECGTCRIVCLEGVLLWNYPKGGHGVVYRY
jgi:ferredoxin like protein